MRFFFTSRRRHTRCGRDWSSDVCSSDLWADLTFDGDSGALASLARSAQPVGLPGAALKTTFHPGLPGMATSPDVGTAWSRPQSEITVKPAGSFDHVPAGGGGGNTVTVTAPVPLCASLVAVIV